LTHRASAITAAGTVEPSFQLEHPGVAVLHVVRLVLQQPLGASHPAGAHHAFSAEEVVERDPDGRHGRRAGPALVQVAPVGLLEDGQRLVDLAQPPGGVAEGFQVLGRQLAGCPGRREAFAGAWPVPAPVGIPGGLQDLGRLVHGCRHG
jgi:hypothetical protein